ncbi:MAG TPA: hypothetical protein VGZ27_10305 [Vicinamibacterales bacterium]|jgi:hypothetical protein|nr:hypothetical protein [Vicinamibacterales bacterium]
MKPKVLGLAAVCSILCLTAPAAGQPDVAEQRATRDRLGALVRTYGPTVKIDFYPWAADDSGDVLARFQFTLESGFPAESIRIVLKSIKSLDQYVGQMRPDIDGSSAL